MHVKATDVLNILAIMPELALLRYAYWNVMLINNWDAPFTMHLSIGMIIALLLME